MSPRWRNVFFDLDGTLVDTIRLIVDSHLHALGEVIGPDHGYEEEEEIRTWIGTPVLKVFERIAPDRAQLINECYVAWNEAHTAAYIDVYPGMRELLADLATAGVNFGVVTSKRRRPTNLAFGLTDLTDAVPFVVTADDVTDYKPLPEPLVKAMEHVGGTPLDSVYVGDAVLDMQAAHNAGLPGVAVTWGAQTGEQLAAADPEFIVTTAEELRGVLLPREEGR